jgi:hypothetical protein
MQTTAGAMVRSSKRQTKSKFQSSAYHAWIRDHHSVNGWPVGGHILLKRAVNRHLACKTIQYAQLLKNHDSHPCHPLQQVSCTLAFNLVHDTALQHKPAGTITSFTTSIPYTRTFDPLNVDAAREPVLVQDLVAAPRPANHNAAAPEHIVNVQRPAALRTMKSKLLSSDGRTTRS